MTSTPHTSTTAAGLRLPAHRMSRKAPWIWCIGICSWMLVRTAVVAGIVWWRVDDLWPQIIWWCLIPVAIGVFELCVVAPLRYRVHRWEVNDTAIYTRTGWWTASTSVVPMNRVQDVDVNQSLFQRMLGLATVNAETAGSGIAIQPIDADKAQDLADRIIAIARTDTGDAT